MRLLRSRPAAAAGALLLLTAVACMGVSTGGAFPRVPVYTPPCIVAA